MIIEKIPVEAVSPELRDQYIDAQYSGFLGHYYEDWHKVSNDRALHYVETELKPADPAGYAYQAELYDRFRNEQVEDLATQDDNPALAWDDMVENAPKLVMNLFRDWQYDLIARSGDLETRMAVEEANLPEAVHNLQIFMTRMLRNNGHSSLTAAMLTGLWKARNITDFNKHAVMFGAYRSYKIDCMTQSGMDIDEAMIEWNMITDEYPEETIDAAIHWFVNEATLANQSSVQPSS